ncbi:FACT complex subunit SSRP1 [Euphorbia peplus]|nr:FACT complex subunit SSRP1 [Euphorbia peplus]
MWSLRLTVRNWEVSMSHTYREGVGTMLDPFMYSDKGLKIMNLGSQTVKGGVAAVLQNADDDDAVDPHLERIRNAAADESDEEDEDFVADKDDGGSPTNDSGGDDSDGSDSGDEKEKPVKKEPPKEASSSKVAAKKRPKEGNGDASKKKKQKKKKDPNAPKKAISSFMYYSQMERENVKKTHLGIAFGGIGKVVGEKWKKLTAEEKESYEAKARADKKRYEEEMGGYKNPQPVNVDSGNETDSEE